MNHCTCNYIPGLARFGEIDDLAGLIAPRSMLIEASTRDPFLPLGSVEAAVQGARQTDALFGAADQRKTDIFEGRHQISGRRAYDFLWEKLA